MRGSVPAPAITDILRSALKFLNRPGNDPFIEFVCDRLLDGRAFNMPDGLLALSEREVQNA